MARDDTDDLPPTLPCGPSEGLRELLTLRALGDDCFVNRYHERNLGGEAFGGQYLGQALMAALATGAGLAPHAMTAYFLRAARAERALHFRVLRVRDGLQFVHRRVEVTQGGSPVFCADVSLHDAEPHRPDHASALPAVPMPDDLAPIGALLERHGPAVPSLGLERMRAKRLVESRPVDERLGLVQRPAAATFSTWLRVLSWDEGDALLQYAALAYLSDHWSNASGRILHLPSLFTPGSRGSSLNHGIWFHRPPDLRDWVLYSLDSPSASGGTGFNRGLMHGRDGTLYASTVQESLVRLPR